MIRLKYIPEELIKEADLHHLIKGDADGEFVVDVTPKEILNGFLEGLGILGQTNRVIEVYDSMKDAQSKTWSDAQEDLLKKKRIWQHDECCVSCKKALDDHEVYYSNGRCPLCGYKKNPGTICETFDRVYYLESLPRKWYEFWKPKWRKVYAEPASKKQEGQTALPPDRFHL